MKKMNVINKNENFLKKSLFRENQSATPYKLLSDKFRS